MNKRLIIAGLLLLAFGEGATWVWSKGSPFLSYLKTHNATGIEAGSPLKKRILSEYGALWINEEPGVILPPYLIFPSAKETQAYQRQLNLGALPGQAGCRLQRTALKALIKAQAEGKLTPRGVDGCLRDYDMTEKLWLSRVKPNLAHYLSTGQLKESEAQRIRQAPLNEQILLILALEKRGLLFDKYRQTSILNSVAAPGTSQHLSGLAFDLAEYGDPKACALMNRYGWFQTVNNDLPHFTYLGIHSEKELKARGLKKLNSQGHTFWVPDL